MPFGVTLEMTRVDLQRQIDAIKSANTDRMLFAGQPFKAAVDLPLRCAVRRDATGLLIPATDTVFGGDAIGMIDTKCAAGASTVIYGSGATFTDIGLSGVTDGAEIFLGTDGAFSLSGVGAPRLIQQVGIYLGGIYYFDFKSAGLWVAA